jgi:hypothetical protein
MKISTHLNLAEVTRSDTAKRNGIDNTPTAEHLENFKLLAEKVFEPIRLHFKEPIFISSGYRSQALNAFIKGSASSQQLIWEFGTDSNPDWVHVSYVKTGNRKQKLKAVRSGGKTTYLPI